MKNNFKLTTLLKLPSDIIFAYLALISAYQLRPISDFIPGIQLPFNQSEYLNFNEFLIQAHQSVALLILISIISGTYSFQNPKGLAQEIVHVSYNALIWILSIITYFFIIREFPFSRLVLLYSFIFMAIFPSLGRIILHRINKFLLKRGFGRQNLLLIGSNNLAEEFFKHQKNNPEYKIIGYLAANPNPKIHSKYLGTLNELEKFVQTQKIDRIIQTNSEIPQIESLHLIDFCQSEHIQYSFIPSNLEVQRSNLEIETNAGMPIIKIKTTPIDGWNRIIKRIFDIFGAIVGLIIFSIPMAIIAIAIKIDSKGPIIFCRKDDGSPVYRIGQYGKKIRFYKFRTMKPNTDSLRYNELAAQNIRKDSPLVKIKDDPRITKLGRFLRKSSLDELPQFWSVLIGDLSLVGPRAHLPEEVAKYQKHQHFVLNIKPGVTGLAQISGRSDLSFDEEIRLDRYYIENWSLWKDIKILLKTLLVPFQSYSE